MGREITQYDIPDHLLRVTHSQPRADMRKDIGEAKITHTIFGRAKVRIIREQDKKRRAWLFSALAAMSLTAAVWQGWITLQQTGLLQSAGSPSSRETVQVGAPAFQPENISPSATLPSVKSTPRTLLQTEIDSLVASPKSVPQPPLGLKASRNLAAKPGTTQPLIASKSQATLPAINSNSSVNQTDKQQPSKLPATIQSVVPTVSAPSATQSAASKPAAVAPPVAPSIKENTPTLSPAGEN